LGDDKNAEMKRERGEEGTPTYSNQEGEGERKTLGKESKGTVS